VSGNGEGLDLVKVAMGINAHVAGMLPAEAVFVLTVNAPLVRNAAGVSQPDLSRLSVSAPGMEKAAVSLIEAAVAQWAETTRKQITAGRLIVP